MMRVMPVAGYEQSVHGAALLVARTCFAGLLLLPEAL
jgi:hypothetical protein